MAAGQPHRHWPTGWQAPLWNRDNTPCFSLSKTGRVSEGELELMLWRHKAGFLPPLLTEWLPSCLLHYTPRNHIHFIQQKLLNLLRRKRVKFGKFKLDYSRKPSGFKFSEAVKNTQIKKIWIKWIPKWPMAVDGRNELFGWPCLPRCESRPCNF